METLQLQSEPSAPEDAVVRNTEDNAGEDEDGSEEGSDQTPAEDKTE